MSPKRHQRLPSDVSVCSADTVITKQPKKSFTKRAIDSLKLSRPKSVLGLFGAAQKPSHPDDPALEFPSGDFESSDKADGIPLNREEGGSAHRRSPTKSARRLFHSLRSRRSTTATPPKTPASMKSRSSGFSGTLRTKFSTLATSRSEDPVVHSSPIEIPEASEESCSRRPSDLSGFLPPGPEDNPLRKRLLADIHFDELPKNSSPHTPSSSFNRDRILSPLPGAVFPWQDSEKSPKISLNETKAAYDKLCPLNVGASCAVPKDRATTPINRTTREQIFSKGHPSQPAKEAATWSTPMLDELAMEDPFTDPQTRASEDSKVATASTRNRSDSGYGTVVNRAPFPSLSGSSTNLPICDATNKTYNQFSRNVRSGSLTIEDPTNARDLPQDFELADGRPSNDTVHTMASEKKSLDIIPYKSPSRSSEAYSTNSNDFGAPISLLDSGNWERSEEANYQKNGEGLRVVKWTHHGRGIQTERICRFNFACSSRPPTCPTSSLDGDEDGGGDFCIQERQARASSFLSETTVADDNFVDVRWNSDPSRRTTSSLD